MLKLQQSEVRDLEIRGREEMIIRRRGENNRSGITKSRTIRSGKTRAGILESRSLGGSGPSGGVGRMRAGTVEARSLGGSPSAMSTVAVPCSNSCSVPKCNDFITCLLVFSD